MHTGVSMLAMDRYLFKAMAAIDLSFAHAIEAARVRAAIKTRVIRTQMTQMVSNAQK